MKNVNYEELKKLCQEKSRERRNAILAVFGFFLRVFVILLTINLIRDGNSEINKFIISFIVIILLMMYVLGIFLSEKNRLIRYLKQKPNASTQEAYQFLFKDN